jgi:hypothetical protein
VELPRIEPVQIAVDDRVVDSATSAGPSGSRYVFVVQTSIADAALPVSVHSAYVGAEGTDTLVTHLVQVPGREPRLGMVGLGEDAMPVPHARERLLLDHLQRVQDVLADLGHAARIELGDEALSTVAG